jgi:ethanolaminephosphotransferase
MAPKQREMDDVIRRLYEYLEQRDAEDGGRSLLVVVGDHGMTEVRSLPSSLLLPFPLTVLPAFCLSRRAATTAAPPKPKLQQYFPPFPRFTSPAHSLPAQALLLASPSFSPVLPPQIEHDRLYQHHEIVQQLDLVPTLSVLFDLGVPTYACLVLSLFPYDALIRSLLAATRWASSSSPPSKRFDRPVCTLLPLSSLRN